MTGIGSIEVTLRGSTETIEHHPGETIIGAARRAGLTPPYNCEAGNCATCIGHITSGSATMAVNDALDDDEVEDGWVLTCQAVPDTSHVVVSYES